MMMIDLNASCQNKGHTHNSVPEFLKILFICETNSPVTYNNYNMCLCASMVLHKLSHKATKLVHSASGTEGSRTNLCCPYSYSKGKCLYL